MAISETSLGRPGSGPVDMPPEMRLVFTGFGLFAASPNVIMQLAWLPVGHGVALSTVDSGRADLHPLKRTRTTLGFLMIAMFGSEEERRRLRQEINRSHRHVHSRPGDAVAYDAFDAGLQLWVAACLYKGFEDVYRWLSAEPPSDALLDRFYAYSVRLGATLQMPAAMWPADRTAFWEYWEAGVAKIEMDDVTRPYLRRIADQSFLFDRFGRLAGPFRAGVAPVARLTTGGYLPEPFRRELGMAWTARDQRRFEQFMRVTAAISQRLPRRLREAPFNYCLWDTRRRLRSGKPFV